MASDEKSEDHQSNDSSGRGMGMDVKICMTTHPMIVEICKSALNRTDWLTHNLFIYYIYLFIYIYSHLHWGGISTQDSCLEKAVWMGRLCLSVLTQPVETDGGPPPSLVLLEVSPFLPLWQVIAYAGNVGSLK